MRGVGVAMTRPFEVGGPTARSIRALDVHRFVAESSQRPALARSVAMTGSLIARNRTIAECWAIFTTFGGALESRMRS